MTDRRNRILVVDDEDDIRLIVGLNLSLMGMTYGEAESGAQAIEMLKTGEWDGCILDLAMPQVDGFTVLKALAERRALDKLAVVVLSAKGSPQAAIEAMRLGAHAHLTKPFSPPSVAQTVLELVRLSPEERSGRRHELLARAGTLDRLGIGTV